jgi:hypothetical protein
MKWDAAQQQTLKAAMRCVFPSTPQLQEQTPEALVRRGLQATLERKTRMASLQQQRTPKTQARDGLQLERCPRVLLARCGEWRKWDAAQRQTLKAAMQCVFPSAQQLQEQTPEALVRRGSQATLERKTRMASLCCGDLTAPQQAMGLTALARIRQVLARRGEWMKWDAAKQQPTPRAAMGCRLQT